MGARSTGPQAANAVITAVAGHAACLLIVLAGCLGPSSTVCPGGRLCPAGLACLALDGDEVCILPTCGDGLLDPGEGCDDGNHDSGDACRFDCCAGDCPSDQRCGNRIVDLLVGESCDDGNARSADGCSSTCEAETPRWQLERGGPGPRVGHAMAYDPIRDRVVLFGGCVADNDTCTGGGRDDTWEWDGARWNAKSPVDAPAPRSGHAMVFDAARGTIVLFGGCAQWQPQDPPCLAPLSDTWEWDGGSWTRRTPSTSPSARSEHALAYDAARGKVVLFGGRHAGSETWEWDGEDWVQHASEGPPERSRHAMVFDASRDRVVMFGGVSTAISLDPVPLGDLWEWDGAGWTPRPTVVAPSARGGHALAYDAVRRVVVMIGGCEAYDPMRPATPSACVRARGDHWAWDGAAWSAAAALDPPAKVLMHALAYDLRRHLLVMFGGREAAGYSATTREHGATWRMPASAEVPAGGWNVSLVYDVRHDTIVMFGTYGLDGSSVGTWEWDGGWRRRTTNTEPPTQGEAAIAYDAARDRVVLFGHARSDPTFSSETWELDDTGWIRRNPITRPPPRIRPALAYDPAHRKVVLFGGQTLAGEKLDDTWAWDGTTWTAVAPVAGPSGRSFATLAFDAKRQRLVLFGGLTAAGPLDDLWEWDGTTWIERPTAVGPGPRGGGALAYDPVRATVVLFGGPGDETWEWNGTTWRQLMTLAAPPARNGHGLVYDPRRRRLVMFGGATGMTVWSDTWLLGHEATGPTEACEAGFDADRDGAIGCDDPDCAAVCDPWCLTLGVCDGPRPSCGNGACDPRESCRSCRADCGPCAPVCGDVHCDPGESSATCRSDCR